MQQRNSSGSRNNGFAAPLSKQNSRSSVKQQPAPTSRTKSAARGDEDAAQHTSPSQPPVTHQQQKQDSTSQSDDQVKGAIERMMVTLRLIEDVKPYDKDREWVTFKRLGYRTLVPKGRFTAGQLCLYLQHDCFIHSRDQHSDQVWFEILGGRRKKMKTDMGKEGFFVGTDLVEGDTSDGVALPVDAVLAMKLLCGSKDLITLCNGEAFNAFPDQVRLRVERMAQSIARNVPGAADSGKTFGDWATQYLQTSDLEYDFAPLLPATKYDKPDESGDGKTKNNGRWRVKFENTDIYSYCEKNPIQDWHGQTWEVTEKLDGQSFTAFFDDEGRDGVATKNVAYFGDKVPKLEKNAWINSGLRAAIQVLGKRYAVQCELVKKKVPLIEIPKRYYQIPMGGMQIIEPLSPIVPTLPPITTSTEGTKMEDGMRTSATAGGDSRPGSRNFRDRDSGGNASEQKLQEGKADERGTFGGGIYVFGIYDHVTERYLTTAERLAVVKQLQEAGADILPAPLLGVYSFHDITIEAMHRLIQVYQTCLAAANITRLVEGVVVKPTDQREAKKGRKLIAKDYAVQDRPNEAPGPAAHEQQPSRVDVLSQLKPAQTRSPLKTHNTLPTQVCGSNVECNNSRWYGVLLTLGAMAPGGLSRQQQN